MTSSNGQPDLYFDLTLTEGTVRFIAGLLEGHRTYRTEGIRLLRERFGEGARTGFVENELAKAERALQEIRDQCLLD